MTDKINKILDFFNNAKSPQEISSKIRDNPSKGTNSPKAYGIKISTSKKILEKRDQLPGKKFTKIDQIDSVRGIGPDTLEDIFHTFGLQVQSEANSRSTGTETSENNVFAEISASTKYRVTWNLKWEVEGGKGMRTTYLAVNKPGKVGYQTFLSTDKPITSYQYVANQPGIHNSELPYGMKQVNQKSYIN